ncbi:hypothetical protein MTO96_032056 [Rhipicephalus appendiculatus]
MQCTHYTTHFGPLAEGRGFFGCWDSERLPWVPSELVPAVKSRAWFSEGTNEFDSFDFSAVPDETPASVHFGTSETRAHSAAGIKDASCVSVPTSACFSA